MGGFTFIEMIVAVAIVGILAAVAVPNFQHMVSKSRQKEAKGNLRYLYTAMKNFWGEHAYYTPRFDAIGFNPEGQLDYVYGFSNDVIPKNPALGTASCIATGPAQPGAGTCNYPNAAPVKWQNSFVALNSGAATGTAWSTGFIAKGVGKINGLADDVWTIDSNDNLNNVTPAL